jgi:type II secretory pathway pseudopilin PulG
MDGYEGLGASSDEDRAVEQAARAAMAEVEVARTGVTRPVNGSAPYSWVFFAGARIRFDQTDFSKYHNGSVVYDAATDKAAKQAISINEMLMGLALSAAMKGFAAAQARAENGADAQLIHDALRFLFWAAGEGISPINTDDAPEPEEAFWQYGLRTDDEDWGTVAERYAIAQAIDARSGETGTGSTEGESAVPQGCAAPSPANTQEGAA